MQGPTPPRPDHAAAAHILLVDDDPAIRCVFGEALRDLGLTISLASSHEHALTLLETQPTPDLLITDVDLGPGKSGLDLADHTHTTHPTLPILLISGHHTHPTHPTPLLPKPFRLPDLLAAITQLLPGVGELRAR